MGDEPTGISLPGYTLITVSWNTWGKLYQPSAVEHGRQRKWWRPLCKRQGAVFKRLLAWGLMTGMILEFCGVNTTGALEWSVNVTVERGQQRTPQQKFNQTGIHVNAHIHTHSQQVVITAACVRSMLRSHTQTGSCWQPAASVWLWLSVVLFLISVLSHRCFLLCCVCVCWAWWHVCTLVCAAVATPASPSCVHTPPPPPPWRISLCAQWGGVEGLHHSQSFIHRKFNFSDTLGWFVLWHGLYLTQRIVSQIEKVSKGHFFHNGSEQSKI